MRFSVFNIIKQGFKKNQDWGEHWRKAMPKSHYDIIIIGGGGHGLATAYYLAKEFGRKNIAVIEKGWIGSGNVGRNTTIVRSNYLLPQNEPFYEFSMKLWEGLEQDLNYNAMMSQRGIINLLHTDAQVDAAARRGNAMIFAGAGAVLLDAAGVKKHCPFLDFDGRYPIKGGLWQPRAGTARHDAVAWGYARGADQHGVDIIENCEVQDIIVENNICKGVKTTHGDIMSEQTALCVAGSSSKLMAMVGIDLPIESHVLQAFVTEGLKPVLPGVVTFGAGHFYISQSDKGGLVFGGDLDGYNSYAQRGNLPLVEDVMAEAMAVMPMVGRARLLRSWGGIMDMSMDGTPFIDKTQIDGLFFNGGWCYGGFKAIPASGYCYAHLLAQDKPHDVAKSFRLDRFWRGEIIDEKGSGPHPNHH